MYWGGLECNLVQVSLQSIPTHVDYIQTRSSYAHSGNYLLYQCLFCKSRFCVSKPPCYFGWQIIDHTASLHFFLCWPYCRKNFDLKYSIFFRTPLGISMKQRKQKLRLDKTELIRTNLPPNDNSFSFQLHSLSSIMSSIIFQSLLFSFL
jgi:hypothetical protein